MRAQEMDYWEGNSDQPRKRICLEHIVESQISYSTIQGSSNDRGRRQDSSCPHGVYGQESRRCNLGLADDNDNALTWRHNDIHQRLTIDYQEVTFTESNQSTRARSIGNVTCIASNVSRSQTFLSSNDGGAEEVLGDVVCFGMVLLKLLRGAL